MNHTDTMSARSSRDKAVDDYVDGVKLAVIAERHNVSTAVLYKELQKRGVKVKRATWKLTLTQRNDVQRRIQEGQSVVNIRKLFPFVSKQYIYKIKKDHDSSAA